jgi:hypothetical protein
MDIQVNKDQLDRVVIKWLNNHYGNLTVKEISHIPDSVFYVNSKNKEIMDYTINNKILHMEVEILVSLTDLFKIDQSEVRSIIRKWVYETYDIEADRVFGADYNS